LKERNAAFAGKSRGKARRAILITGYFGGATATNLRIGEPFFGPVIAGMLPSPLAEASQTLIHVVQARVLTALFPLRRK
jgi:hypothetical protein